MAKTNGRRINRFGRRPGSREAGCREATFNDNRTYSYIPISRSLNKSWLLFWLALFGAWLFGLCNRNLHFRPAPFYSPNLISSLPSTSIQCFAWSPGWLVGVVVGDEKAKKKWDVSENTMLNFFSAFFSGNNKVFHPFCFRSHGNFITWLEFAYSCF